jgi:hypothetical protein
MWRYLKRMIIGKPLKTLDEGGMHLTKFKALALLSSDALSSVAYGPEHNYELFWLAYLRPLCGILFQLPAWS